ncbi:MAG TPA: hypothetical protein VJB10_01100 [Candidatus Peribacteraceae bacterium]|nr:hypothetical protein [Candidatus Peribacteraceae bacterium]
MAIVPPLIALSYSAIHSEVPEMIQKMQVIPSYPSVQEGMIGDDLYQRFLSARAWADGLSPYKEVPIQYLYLGQSVPFYPPVTYWLYSKIVPLGYKAVYIIHTVIKIAVFLAAVSWVLWAARAKSLIPLTVFVCLSCILLSPVGRTELWVGQFEYFVASAYALVFAMLFCKRMMWIPAAGVLASIKISSLTFIAPFSLVALLSDRKRSVSLAGVLAVMLCILVLFFPYLIDFSRHIIAHEFVRTALYSDRIPIDISFARILPYYIGKGIIFVCTAIVLIVILCIRESHCRAAAFLAASFPFAVMLMLQGAGFGLRAWVYKGVTLLALLPGLYFWLKADLVPVWFQRLVAGLFTVLLAILLNLYPLRPFVLLRGPEDMVWVYLYASGMFFVLTLVVIRLWPGGSSFQKDP